jgi:type I restriction enzyme S subunit
MAKLFREGLRGEPLKQTEVGEIPESWDVVPFEELFDVQQGKAVSPRSRQGLRPRPFLRTVNVLWGRTDLTTLDRMDFSYEETARLSLAKGDLLVCEGGDVGRTAMWTSDRSDCGFQNHIHRARRRSDAIEPRFYMHWMEHAITQRNLYLSQANRTTIPNLSASRLRALRVPEPPDAREQAQIGGAISLVEDRIELAQKARKASSEVFTGALQDLLTGGIRVSESVEAHQLAEEG